MNARHFAWAGVSVVFGASGSMSGLRLRGGGSTGWVPRAVSSSMACSLVQSPSASQLTGRGRVALLDVVMHQVLRDTESITHASATVMSWVV
jgi:hypothetical protein